MCLPLVPANRIEPTLRKPAPIPTKRIEDEHAVLEELAKLTLDDEAELEDDSSYPSSGPAARHPEETAPHALGRPGPPRPSRLTGDEAAAGDRAVHRELQATRPSLRAHRARQGLALAGARARAEAPHPQAPHAPRRRDRLRGAARRAGWRGRGRRPPRGITARESSGLALAPRRPRGLRHRGRHRQPAASARQSRRRPLFGDLARDGGKRRLGHAAPERHQVLRETAAAVLGDRRRLRDFRHATRRPRASMSGSRHSRHSSSRALPAWRLWGEATSLATMLALVASPYFMALGGIVTLDMGLTYGPRRLRGAAAGRACGGAAAGTAALDARLLGRHGARGALQGPGGHRVRGREPCSSRWCCARSLAILKRMHWGWGLAIFLAIAAPWFILVSRANPEFAHFFFVHEHFERFLTHEHRRVQPAWFFIPIVVAGFLPWMVAIFAATWKAWREEAGQQLPAASPGAPVERLHPALLQRVGLEAAGLRAAALPLAGTRAGALSRIGTTARASRPGSPSSRCRESASSSPRFTWPTARVTRGRRRCT